MRSLIVTALVLAACTPPAAAAPAAPTAPIATPSPPPTLAPVPTPTPTPVPAPDWNAMPPVAKDAAGLAAQLAAAERAIRDPAITGTQLVWFGHSQQLAISEVNDRPELTAEVLAGLPPAYHASVEGTMLAGRALRSMGGGPPARTLPNWQIVDPLPQAELLRIYKEAEQRFGVPWYYLAAINLVETRMGRIRGLSSAGARGPMQFMAPTWAAYGLGGNVEDPRDAIHGAANYLRANGAPATIDHALFRYNHSDAYVASIKGYAEVLRNDPDAFRGYHGWQVYYATVDGVHWLKTGWTRP